MFCPVGKINCAKYVTIPDFVMSAEVKCNYAPNHYIDVSGLSFEVCPFPSRQEIVEEKIVLELTREEAYWLYTSDCNEYPNAFGISNLGDEAFSVNIKGFRSARTKIKALKIKWDEEHK